MLDDGRSWLVIMRLWPRRRGIDRRRSTCAYWLNDGGLLNRAKAMFDEFTLV